MKLGIILGTRPEIIKLSPIIRECQNKNIDFFILHTNQHYSSNMDKVFFEELELPQPKYNLNIQESLHGKMTARMLIGIEEILIKEKPELIFIQGDTNTVLAGGLAASKLGIKIGHVEAGLRSYDRTMPEEINRVVADHLSDFLFCPTVKQANILLNEGIEKRKVFITGNTIVDSVYQNIEIADKHSKYSKYKKMQYVLLTIHRPSNADNKINLERILKTITKISRQNNLKVIFPIHPRTKKNIDAFNIIIDNSVIILMDPVGYLEMLSLEKNAKIILTDSGGIQEEACILGIPSITLRENTERPETLEVGASILAGSDPNKISEAFKSLIKSDKSWLNPFGDGKTSLKLINIINIRK